MENGERGRAIGSSEEEEAESKESTTHAENNKNASQTEAKEVDSTGSE